VADEPRILVGVTGASGMAYARRLIEALGDRADVIVTKDAEAVIEVEAGLPLEAFVAGARTVYGGEDLAAAPASGSHRFRALVVVPCSGTTLAKIATGIADNLVTRAAAVALKERRVLILVPRETPLSVIALALPALFYYSSLAPGVFAPGTAPLPADEERARLLALSLVVGAVMLAVYLLGLVYSLVTHKHLFHEEVPAEAAAWSKRKALAVMALATGGVALMAEALVSSVEGLTSTLGLSELFVGVVIVAIVGNAAEHSTAILVALKNKMDLAFQIAAGSSAQIALFVAPVLIFYSFAIGRPMELVFEVFELFAIAVAVAVAYAVSIDEEANWFEGALLVGVYVIICAVFFVHP